MTAKDKKGISALHYAAGQGRLEVLQYLWSKGLDLDADDPGAAHSISLCSTAGSLPDRHSLKMEYAVVWQACHKPCRIVNGMPSSSQAFRFHT